LWQSAALGLAIMAALSVLLVARRPGALRGAVMVASSDPMKQLPVAGVQVSLTGGAINLPGGPAEVTVRSDASGLFRIPLSWRMRVGQRMLLQFRHPDYQPLDLHYTGPGELYLAHLVPLNTAEGPDVTISNIVAKYSVSTTTAVNIGSAVRTFEVVNMGNHPCNGLTPCSPDGEWKAAIATAQIDAGVGNEFHNARVSCIAGPCAFTRIEENVNRARPSRIVRVSVLDWSDTATFLLEAEVYRPMVSDSLRQSYPVIFDRALTFTLPPAADNISIVADVDGKPIVFPLGPSLHLSWANCQLAVNPDQAKVCRCEAKPGFRLAAAASPPPNESSEPRKSQNR